jgi:hypothetical protein
MSTLGLSPAKHTCFFLDTPAFPPLISLFLSLHTTQTRRQRFTAATCPEAIVHNVFIRPLRNTLPPPLPRFCITRDAFMTRQPEKDGINGNGNTIPQNGAGGGYLLAAKGNPGMGGKHGKIPLSFLRFPLCIYIL